MIVVGWSLLALHGPRDLNVLDGGRGDTRKWWLGGHMYVDGVCWYSRGLDGIVICLV